MNGFVLYFAGANAITIGLTSPANNLCVGEPMLQAILSLLFVFIAAIGLLSATAPSPRQRLERPNVVIFLTDDQEISSLPNMPYLMGQPEGSWVNFNNGFVNDAICTPSRASMLTGQYAANHGVTLNGQGGALDDSNTIATWLDDAGYTTALFGKYSNGYPWDKGANWKPLGWDEFNGTLGNTVQITETAVDFLESVDGPFFLNINYRAPHYGVTPSAAYRNADVLIPPRPPSMPEEDTSDKPAWVQALRMNDSTLAAIDGRRTIAYRTLLDVDDGVRAVIETLEAQGELDNTVLIYLSDHGFSFGAHNWERKHCPYEECHRIPFMIRYPLLEGSRTDERYVSVVDIVPTIVDLTGVTPGLPQDGRSLVPLLTDPAYPWDNVLLFEKFYDRNLTFSYFGARMPGWKYIEYDTGERELYDLTADPYELENRAGLPAYAAKQAELAEVLALLLAGERPLELTPTPTPAPTATPTATATLPPGVTATPIPTATATPVPTSTIPPAQLEYRAWLPWLGR